MRFLRVPIDLQRDTGYRHAVLSLTLGTRTRQFRIGWLRAR